MSEVLETLQNNLTFGSGEFLRPLFKERYAELGDLSPRDQATLVGYADGCPVTQALTDPANPDPNRGPEKMLDRYGEVNFWFRHIVHTAKEFNPQLAAELQLSVSRQEPSGENFEQASVPPSFYREMAPMGTLWGYAASRILVKQLGGNELPQDESQRRLDTGLAILNSSVAYARSPEGFLALLAEGVARSGDVHPQDILHEALSRGWYGEHHATSMAEDVKGALRLKAPELWAFYESLDEQQKLEAGVLSETLGFETAAGSISVRDIEAYHNEAFGYMLWENVIDPARPEGPRGIVMYVPAGSMSKVWELLEEGYEESIEMLRGSGAFVFQRNGSDDWVTAPLDSEHPTADNVRVGKGDKFSVVADSGGIVVFSRPSKDFDISFERDVSKGPGDELSRRVAQVALARAVA